MELPVRKGRLQVMADELGITVEELIPRLMSEEGTIYKAAIRANVTPNAIRYWLLKLGYKPEIRPSIEWVKEETA